MIFQIIYQLADQHNEAALSKLISSKELSTLDIFDSTGMHTPMSLLAFQGKIDAVNWLIEFDKFLGDDIVFADPGEAVKGYAMGGYDEEVEKLLDSQSNARSAVYTGYNPYMPYFIHGCAMGGRVDKVNQLLSENKYKGLRDAAINGYRAAGNLVELNVLMNDTVTMFDVPWGGKLCMFHSGVVDKIEHGIVSPSAQAASSQNTLEIVSAGTPKPFN